MSCDNVITVQDLETDKKHSTFYREVITGKAGGTGADIDSATNAVTGQTQATLPKVLSNVGFSPAGFDFTTGGTLTERDKAIFYQADGNWYSWGGTLPKVVPPASSPLSTGGIADNAWNVSTSAFMYRDWEGFTAELLAQAGIVDDGQPDVLGASQRVDAMTILSIAKTLNVPTSDITYSTAGLTLSKYVYDPSQQVTYSVPDIVQGEVIVSVAGNQLTSSVTGVSTMLDTNGHLTLVGGNFNKKTAFIPLRKDGVESSVNGALNNINLSTVPYSATIGGVDVWLLDARYPDKTDPMAFWAGGYSVAADSTASFNALASLSRTMNLGSDRKYTISGFVGLQDSDLYGEEAFYITGSGSTIEVTAPLAPFTSRSYADDNTRVDNVFTGKVFVSGINFTGVGADGVFDVDHIYNLNVTDCHFANLNRVFTSYREKPGHVDGYIQSLFIDDCIFSTIYEGIILAKNAYNVVFTNNMCERCHYGIIIDGASTSYAIHNIRLVNNLFEGGGVFVRATHTLAGVISGNYLELNTIGNISIEKAHMVLDYDVAGASTNPSTWLIEGNSSQDSVTQRADAGFGMMRINGNYKTVTLNGNWADSAVTISPITNATGNYSRRPQKYVISDSPQSSYVDTKCAHLQRPLSYNLAGDKFRFMSLALENTPNTAYSGAVLDINVVLRAETSDGKIFGECAFDCKVLISPYGSGVDEGYGRPAYYDIKGGIYNFMEQQATLVDNRYGASTIKMFSATPVFSFVRSGSVIHLVASNFQNNTIPHYGDITTVKAATIISINPIVSMEGVSACNWVRYIN